MLIQRGGRTLSVLGVCFSSDPLLLLLSYFYYVSAEPRPVVLLSKIMGGGRVVMPCCDTMIFAAAQAIFLTTRVFGICSECLLMLTRLTCGNRGKLHLTCFHLARAPEGRCYEACLYNCVLISKMTQTFF